MEALEFNTCEIGFSSISRAFLGSNSVMVTPGYAGRKLGLGLGLNFDHDLRVCATNLFT
jgi:hypothetical protein